MSPSLIFWVGHIPTLSGIGGHKPPLQFSKSGREVSRNVAHKASWKFFRPRRAHGEHAGSSAVVLTLPSGSVVVPRDGMWGGVSLGSSTNAQFGLCPRVGQVIEVDVLPVAIGVRGYDPKTIEVSTHSLVFPRIVRAPGTSRDSCARATRGLCRSVESARPPCRGCLHRG